MSLKPLGSMERIYIGFLCGQEYYVLLNESRTLARADINTGEICVLDNQCPELLQRVNNKQVWHGMEVDGKIFFPINSTNKLIEFNPEDISYRIIELPLSPGEVTGYRGIGRWKDYLYLYIGKAETLIRYDLKNDVAERLPVDFSKIEHSLFSVYENLGYCFPKNSNYIEVINLDSLEIKKYDAGLRIVNGFHGRAVDEKKALLVDYIDKALRFWSAENGTQKVADIGRGIAERAVLHNGKIILPWFKEGIVQFVDVATGQVNNLYPAPEDCCIYEDDPFARLEIAYVENDRYFIWNAMASNYFVVYDKLTEKAEWKKWMISEENMAKFFEYEAKGPVPMLERRDFGFEELLHFLG